MRKLGNAPLWERNPDHKDEVGKRRWRMLRIRDPENPEERPGFIGASAIPSILRCNGSYEGVVSLWAKTLGRFSETFQGEHLKTMEMGHILEEPAIGEFRRMLKYEMGHIFASADLFQWTVSHPTKSHFKVTPDGVCEVNGKQGLVEIKYTEFDRDGSWSALKHQGEIRPDSKVERHWLQVQAQLCATGLDYAYLVGIVGARTALHMTHGLGPGSEFVVHKVDRDERVVSLIEKEVDVFWEHVTSQTMPEPSHYRDDSTLRALLPKAVLGKVMYDEGATSLVRDARRMKKELSDIRKKYEESKAKIRHLMQDAEILDTGHGKPVTWKNGAKGRRTLNI
tara:strand:- start:154 stop:1167 length:1014 start_codon:yes stop_codon:yes gene_type:complete